MEYEQTCFFSGHRCLPEDPRLLPALEDAIRRASAAFSAGAPWALIP